VIVTHTEKDPFNPDHPLAYEATQRARLLASGAGVASWLYTVRPPELFLFEPHQPEHVWLCAHDVWENHNSVSAEAACDGSHESSELFTSVLYRAGQNIVPITQPCFGSEMVFVMLKRFSVWLPQVVTTLDYT